MHACLSPVKAHYRLGASNAAERRLLERTVPEIEGGRWSSPTCAWRGPGVRMVVLLLVVLWMLRMLALWRRTAPRGLRLSCLPRRSDGVGSRKELDGEYEEETVSL